MTDAGLPDAGLDAGEVDAGTGDAGLPFDAGVLDAGRSIVPYIYVFGDFVSDGGSLRASAATCIGVSFVLYGSDGNSLHAAGNLLVGSGSIAALHTVSTCATPPSANIMVSVVDGMGIFFIRSPSYGSVQLKFMSPLTPTRTMTAELTARLAMHIVTATGGCQRADIGLFSSDGRWVHVPPPNAYTVYSLSSDAGVASNDTTCTNLTPLGVVPSRIDGGVTGFSVMVSRSGLVTAEVASALVAPVEVKVGLPFTATSTGAPNSPCDAGCVTGGCVQEETSVCECIAPGDSCNQFQLHQCCGTTQACAANGVCPP